MKNKILIKVIVPTLGSEFEMFIPVNERISQVKKIIIKALVDISDGEFKVTKGYSLIDPDQGTIYDSRLIIRDTNIINIKRIILY